MVASGSCSAELRGPGQLSRIRPEIADFEPKWAPKPDEAKPKMPGPVPTKPTQSDSERFVVGFGEFRPRSKTFHLRDSSAEAAARATWALDSTPTGKGFPLQQGASDNEDGSFVLFLALLALS